MIDMDVRCNGHHRLAMRQAQHRPERHKSHPGIDDEIDIAPADMKDIASEIVMDVRAPIAA
ncbi:hypothetical protein ACFSQT_35555 [Mesorhizobium calcicola]|uniref:Uncharacterized protein n=1 Tax=Mesorhizobium calcicola TaxID=1300310 RepID=A0ABW4WP12_9HYPH